MQATIEKSGVETTRGAELERLAAATRLENESQVDAIARDEVFGKRKLTTPELSAVLQSTGVSAAYYDERLGHHQRILSLMKSLPAIDAEMIPLRTSGELKKQLDAAFEAAKKDYAAKSLELNAQAGRHLDLATRRRAIVDELFGNVPSQHKSEYDAARRHLTALGQARQSILQRKDNIRGIIGTDNSLTREAATELYNLHTSQLRDLTGELEQIDADIKAAEKTIADSRVNAVYLFANGAK